MSFNLLLTSAVRTRILVGPAEEVNRDSEQERGYKSRTEMTNYHCFLFSAETTFFGFSPFTPTSLRFS
jgi:hypothetical protein